MRFLVMTTIALASVAATHAAELEDFVGVFASDNNGLIFHYTAPMEGFSRTSPTLQWPSDGAAIPFLLDAKGVDPLTGVDFSDVVGVLSVGDPPNAAQVFLGWGEFAEQTRDTLLERNFEKRRIAGRAVLGLGEDNAIDFQNARTPDPFAGGMGRSQRVAVMDRILAVTANWATMENLLVSIDADNHAVAVWRSTFDALIEQDGESYLDSAWGWAADSFIAPSMDVPISPDADLDAIAAEMSDAGQLNFPPFPFAILTHSRSEVGAELRIALPYNDKNNAQQAIDYVSRTLVQFPHVSDYPHERILERDGLFIATFSLLYPVEEAAEAHKLLLDWNAAITRRNFAPLQFAY